MRNMHLFIVCHLDENKEHVLLLDMVYCYQYLRRYLSDNVQLMFWWLVCYFLCFHWQPLHSFIVETEEEQYAQNHHRLKEENGKNIAMRHILMHMHPDCLIKMFILQEKCVDFPTKFAK